MLPKNAHANLDRPHSSERSGYGAREQHSCGERHAMMGLLRSFSGHSCIVSLVATSMFLLAGRASGQQPIDPVDFRPFVDGAHWIVRQQMTYRIGNSQDTLTVPVGFVTDFASIPPALQSIIRQNGLYLLPAVVHDYLYWTQ